MGQAIVEFVRDLGQAIVRRVGLDLHWSDDRDADGNRHWSDETDSSGNSHWA